jgi:hypothetical protein
MNKKIEGKYMKRLKTAILFQLLFYSFSAFL